MKRWKCPKCELEVKAIASQVSHRCPKGKFKEYTNFIQEEEQ